MCKLILSIKPLFFLIHVFERHEDVKRLLTLLTALKEADHNEKRSHCIFSGKMWFK